MTWYVNVNKHTIRDNALRGTDKPPVRISRGKSGKKRYCHEAVLPQGSKILYSSQDPILKCGARLVIECPTEPEVIR